jgi:type IV pilus assembly protein PilW
MIAPPAGSTLPCTVRSVTGVNAATSTNGIQLTFGNTAEFNQVTYPNQTYPSGTALALLDQLSWTRFRIDANSNLWMERPLDGTSAILARGVVGFHAQYGITDGVTTSLQAWVDDAGTSALLPTGVTAVRIGMVLRSSQKEKPDAAGVCAASTIQPILLETPLALSGSWQCYRYRSTVVVVPLRNAQMGGAA